MTPILEITVGRRTRDGARIVVTLERVPGEAPLCFDAPYELDPTSLLGALDAREYGELLGRSVFVDAVADALLIASSAADRHRVRLVIEEPQLQTLRWERLCAPRDGVFVPMGLDQRCLFSIFQPSRSTLRYRPLGPTDLSALVVVACPTNLSEYGLDRFDTTAALLSVTRSLDEMGVPYTVLGHDVGAAGLPTLDAVARWLALVLAKASRAARTHSGAGGYSNNTKSNFNRASRRWLSEIFGCLKVGS